MEVNKIIQGDCLEVLKTLPDQSVNCCITSPPYWGLRDYGVTGQLGLEKTPEEYVAHMVEVFREVRRVLRDDGTLWLNLGDSYFGSGKGGNPEGSKWYGFMGNKKREAAAMPKQVEVWTDDKSVDIYENTYRPNDLVGIPWRVAFALQADGWYLRQDIIWHKPNPMPESVTDRCTKAHEYIFLLSKSAKYYYDAGAIAEESTEWSIGKGWREQRVTASGGALSGGTGNGTGLHNTRNRRSIWTVTTKPFREAHFATFPPDLIEPCALAGCPESGVILDPFMGVGTTAVVAKQNYRNYIGIELNQKYIEIAQKRIDGTIVNKRLEFGGEDETI